MWDVVLSVLSIFGGILLVLLIFAAVFLLLVLFYPITYRVRGQKTVEEKWILAKIKWLSGLLQIKYSYPEPGNVTVRLFGRKVFDTNEKRTKMNKTVKAIITVAVILAAMAIAYALGASGNALMVKEEQADMLVGMLITTQSLPESDDGRVYAGWISGSWSGTWHPCSGPALSCGRSASGTRPR